MWLFKQMNFQSSKEIPAFRLKPNDPLDGFMVRIPKNDSFYSGREDFYWSQNVELSEFIKGSLSKRLKWSLSAGIKLPVRLEGVSIDCWKCKKPTTILLGIMFELGKKFPGCDDVMLKIYDFEKHQELLKVLLPKELYTKHAVGVIKKRYSKTAGGEYLSNGCSGCGAIQGQFFDHEYAHDAAEIMTIEAEVTQPLLDVLKRGEHTFSHWYFAQ